MGKTERRRDGHCGGVRDWTARLLPSNSLTPILSPTLPPLSSTPMHSKTHACTCTRTFAIPCLTPSLASSTTLPPYFSPFRPPSPPYVLPLPPSSTTLHPYPHSVPLSLSLQMHTCTRLLSASPVPLPPSLSLPISIPVALPPLRAGTKGGEVRRTDGRSDEGDGARQRRDRGRG